MAAVVVTRLLNVLPIRHEPELPLAGPSSVPTDVSPLSPSPNPSIASSEFSPSPPSSLAPQPRNVSRTISRSRERKYRCPFEGCDKAYFKPSRLTEHEITHTGERPHKCPHCAQSYFRQNHLQAHLRTHLSQADRPFLCEREECGKRFWTTSHLARHLKMHDDSELYACDQCSEVFPKTHLLRDHFVTAHMPPGTKPFICLYDGCGSSFKLDGQLKTHQKTHDPTRYTCSHPSHEDDLCAFSTWTALQKHLHHDHPPVCPHTECGGRVFKNAQRLKDHLKVHEEREADVARKQAVGAPIGEVESPVFTRKRRRSEAADGGKSPKLVRLTDGVAGKNWPCEEEGCDKRFKTRFAMNAHHKARHLKIRSHTCPFEGCGKCYPYLTTLQHHIASHSRPPSPLPNAVSIAARLTGAAGAERRRFGCPVSIIHEDEQCDMRFWRVYDVRRHIKKDHGMVFEDEEVRRLLVKAGNTETPGGVQAHANSREDGETSAPLTSLLVKLERES